MDLKQILDHFPVGVRERVVARGGFTKKGDRYTCADGMCVWSALIHDHDPELWANGPIDGNAFPHARQVLDTLRALGVEVPELVPWGDIAERLHPDIRGKSGLDSTISPADLDAIDEAFRFANTEYLRIQEVVTSLMEANDSGELATPEAVGAALFPEE